MRVANGHQASVMDLFRGDVQRLATLVQLEDRIGSHSMLNVSGIRQANLDAGV